MAGAAGLATREDKNINEQYTLVGYVSKYGVSAGGGRNNRQGWYVQSVLERTTYGTVGTGDWNPPYAECPRPT